MTFGLASSCPSLRIDVMDLVLPLILLHIKCDVLEDVSHPNKEHFDEEEAPHRGLDRVRAAAGRVGHPGHADGAEDGDFRGDVLSMEAAV